MFCERCGQELPEQANFCFACGNKVAYNRKAKDEMAEGTIRQEAEAVNAAKEPQKETAAITKEQFKGVFDGQAHFSQCYIKREGSGNSRYTNTANYIKYGENIYFLCYKDYIRGWKNPEEKYTWVVFGSIDLSNYRVEILKEYKSTLWRAEGGGHGPLASYDPLISVSNGKIWYITYLHDDAEKYGDEHGPLTIKCLDIDTRTEQIVMKLPKAGEARMPIVMGNVFAYIADGKLVVHNLLTGSSNKRECANIMGYNDSYIYFSKKNCVYAAEDICAVNVLTGEIMGIRNYMKSLNLEMDKNIKLKSIYYINCEKELIYAVLTVKSREIRRAVISVKDKQIKFLDENICGEYKFVESVDGRIENAAFDGMLYVARNRSHTGGCYKNDASEPYEHFLAVIYSSGKKFKISFERLADDGLTLTAMGGMVLAELEPGRIFLNHKGKWHKVFAEYE